ncbi:MAG: PilZ domain-containing protein [Oligoflexia bacterium]|nr:PilZ domain-containing protein [Oligoflexia bacterium]
MSAAINLRNTQRLLKAPTEFWQINVNYDELITRNIINLCPGGVAIKTPQRVKFERGQWLHLQIWLSPEKHFECEAKVVWVLEQSYGLQFFKIPMAFDAFIMRAIHESQTQLNRESLDREFKFPATLIRESQKRLEKNAILSSTLTLAVVAVMTFAIIFAAFAHQHNNPEKSLAYIFSQAFAKKLAK